MGLLDDCKTYFETDNLYSVLMVPETVSDSELKKAYKKCSLSVHPDRVEESEKEAATKRFQVLSKVYCILSDKELRKIYDETGEIDENGPVFEDRDWLAYWRLLYPELTLQDIDKFMDSYKGSAEERNDIKKHYVQCSGDMDKMSAHIIGYRFSEEDRYRLIITEMIKTSEIPSFPAFSEESKAKRNARKRKYEKEAKEAEAAKKEMKIGDGDVFMAVAQQAANRKANYESMISDLEKKYAKPKPRRSKKK